MAVLNKFSQAQDGACRMPDLAYEGESWAVIRLAVPGTHAGHGDGGLVRLGAVAVSFTDLDGNLRNLGPVTVSLPSLTPAAFGAVITEDSVVRQRVQELEAANIQDRAQAAARRGDWPAVRRLLREAQENARDNEWPGRVADKLERLAAESDQMMFSKEAMYASRKMRRRLAGIVESASPDAPVAASYLQRKPEQGKARPPRGAAQDGRR